MRSKMIMDAYDSINPTQQQKTRLLRQILKEGEESTVSRERRYTAKPQTSTWKRVIPGIAACMALILAAGTFLLRNKPEDPTPAVQKPGVKETEADAAPVHDSYTAVLAKYAAALEEGWTEDQCEIEGISVRLSATEYCRDYLGYQLLDLDGNDREELIISDGNSVIDLYTLLEDGTPVQILSWEEDGTRYLLYENAVIGSEFSGKDVYIMEFYKLVNHQLSHSMMELTCEENNWYAAAVGEGRSPVSQEEAMAELEAHQQLSLDITRFYGENASNASGEELELYQLILERYRTALQENWDMQQCSDQDISLLISTFTNRPEELCYLLLDMDGDGIPELIITDGTMIYDLYTVSDGEIAHLLTGWERNAYRLCEDYTLYNHGSSSAFSFVYNYYRVRNGKLEIVESILFDAQKDPENPWFYSTDGEDYSASLTEKESGAIQESYRVMTVQGFPVLGE